MIDKPMINSNRGRTSWCPPIELFSEYPRMSLTTLAAKYDVSRETIKGALLRAGVPLTPLQEALGTQKWTEKQCNEIKRQYLEEQHSIRTIAIDYGHGEKAIRGLLLRVGVVLRRRSTKGLRQTSDTTKACLRETKIGARNPNFGKSPSAITRQRLAEAHRGRKHTPQTKAKMSETRVRRGLSKGDRNPMAKEAAVLKWARANQMKPNRAELCLKHTLDKLFPGAYAVNVTGSILILGAKIPDFVCITGQTKVIELYGDYWHKGENPKNRIDFFASLGYSALVIWERELKQPGLDDRIRQFHCGT